MRSPSCAGPWADRAATTTDRGTADEAPSAAARSQPTNLGQSEPNGFHMLGVVEPGLSGLHCLDDVNAALLRTCVPYASIAAGAAFGIRVELPSPHRRHARRCVSGQFNWWLIRKNYGT